MAYSLPTVSLWQLSPNLLHLPWLPPFRVLFLCITVPRARQKKTPSGITNPEPPCPAPSPPRRQTQAEVARLKQIVEATEAAAKKTAQQFVALMKEKEAVTLTALARADGRVVVRQESRSGAGTGAGAAAGLGSQVRLAPASPYRCVV